MSEKLGTVKTDNRVNIYGNCIVQCGLLEKKVVEGLMGLFIFNSV